MNRIVALAAILGAVALPSCKPQDLQKKSTLASAPSTSGDLPRAPSVSLFDRLFFDAKRQAYDLPYPFDKLLQKMGKVGGTDVNAVMIPLGRSPQRLLASPFFFKEPRLLATYDRFANRSLFIAYLERTQTLEVISYNDDMGRFEFQLVEGYGAKPNPDVFYARRDECMTCHQSGGPIFSQAPWAEMNVSRLNGRDAPTGISEGLESVHGAQLHGIPVRNSVGGAPGVDSEGASFDGAVRDAQNQLVMQQVWTRVCSHPAVKVLECRANLVRSALLKAAGYDAAVFPGLARFAAFDARLPTLGLDTDFLFANTALISGYWQDPRHQLTLPTSKLVDSDPFPDGPKSIVFAPLTPEQKASTPRGPVPVGKRGAPDLFELQEFTPANLHLVDVDNLDAVMLTSELIRGLQPYRSGIDKYTFNVGFDAVSDDGTTWRMVEPVAAETRRLMDLGDAELLPGTCAADGSCTFTKAGAKDSSYTLKMAPATAVDKRNGALERASFRRDLSCLQAGDDKRRRFYCIEASLAGVSLKVGKLLDAVDAMVTDAGAGRENALTRDTFSAFRLAAELGAKLGVAVGAGVPVVASSPRLAPARPVATVSEVSTLKPFFDNCGRCHTATNEPKFMAGKDEAEIWANFTPAVAKAIVAVLQDGAPTPMPPLTAAAEHKAVWQDDGGRRRAAMQAVVAQLGQLGKTAEKK